MDDELKELDALLPPETVEALEAWRELFRAVFTGIPEVRYRIH